MGGVVRNRWLLTVGVAESISGLGSWVTQIAVFALIVFHGGGGIAEASGVWLAGLGPTLLVSPLAGWLSDRFDRKRLMVASEVLCGLTVVGLVLTTRLEAVYALLALQGAFGTLMAPARQAALPDLVARRDLTRANAFLQQLAGLVKIGAPMLAGLILTLVEPRQAMILDAASYALSGLILSRLPALPPHAGSSPDRGPASPSPATPRRGALESLRGLPLLRVMLGLRFLGVATIMGFDVLASIYVRDVLGGDETIFGLAVGLIGLGTVGSAAVLLLLRAERDPWVDVVRGLLLLGAIPATLALGTQAGDPRLVWPLVAIGCLVGGVGSGLLNVQLAALLQLLAPPDLLGRVAGVYQSTVVAGQLVAIFATPLLVPAVVSLGTYFGASAALLGGLAAGTALAVKGLRTRAAGHPSPG